MIRVACGAVAIAALIGAMPVGAVPTNAGGFVALPGTTSAAQPALNGTAIRDVIMPFHAEGTPPTPASGTVQVRVVRGSDGTLAFYWKINVDAASRGSIGSILLSGFPPVVYDANWRSDGLGTVAPAEVRGLSVGGGQKYGFSFPAPIAAGQSSRFFFLKTNARNFGAATAVLYFNGGTTAPIAISVPVS